MNSFTTFIDVIILASGLYAFYTAYMIKVKGNLQSKLLLSNDMDIKKCKDVQGYCTYVFPRLLILGVAATLSGAVNLLNTYVMDLNVISLVLYFVLMAVFIYFSYITKKAMKQFW